MASSSFGSTLRRIHYRNQRHIPLFLIARELRMGTSDAPRLHTTDTILLAVGAVLIAGLTIWVDVGEALGVLRPVDDTICSRRSGAACGWRDRQLPDGTVIWTSPTGHPYTTRPAGCCS